MAAPQKRSTVTRQQKIDLLDSLLGNQISTRQPTTAELVKMLEDAGQSIPTWDGHNWEQHILRMKCNILRNHARQLTTKRVGGKAIRLFQIITLKESLGVVDKNGKERFRKRQVWVNIGRILVSRTQTSEDKMTRSEAISLLDLLNGEDRERVSKYIARIDGREYAIQQTKAGFVFQASMFGLQEAA